MRKVHRERLLQVADLIERNPKRFNMDYYVHTTPYRELDDVRILELARSGGCNTTACICGWAAIVAPKRTITRLTLPDTKGFDFFDFGRHWFGLSEEQAIRLFFPQSGFWIDQARKNRRRKGFHIIDGARGLTARTVAKVLRQIAAGEVTL